MESNVLDHVTSAALVVYVLQMFKRYEWYQRLVVAFPEDRVHQAVAAVGAFIGAVGIHIAVNGSAGGGWSGTFTIPPLLSLLHAGWDWASQMALQQLAFDAAVKTKLVKGQDTHD